MWEWLLQPIDGVSWLPWRCSWLRRSPSRSWRSGERLCVHTCACVTGYCEIMGVPIWVARNSSQVSSPMCCMCDYNTQDISAVYYSFTTVHKCHLVPFSSHCVFPSLFLVTPFLNPLSSPLPSLSPGLPSSWWSSGLPCPTWWCSWLPCPCWLPSSCWRSVHCLHILLNILLQYSRTLCALNDLCIY